MAPSYGGVVSPPPLPPPAVAGAYAPSPVGYVQPQVRPGTLPPGTGIKIGDYEVTIEKFLSEGGFAHVYLVRSHQPIPSPSGSSETYHVLKRVAAADKTVLREIRWEVDVMKLLRGHRYIVNLIEASASIIPGTSGYEVFILMEYCSGGGIIDMMNTRLQNRLTEQEILKIFSDVVEGVCWMHTRSPPLMHRDLKVENILLAGPGFYKLCDFGSTAVPKDAAAQTMHEIQELELELNKHTTLQYRAPEMCDVWSRKGVGLPADIWALGVLLYKLCFYTTPFEEHGPLAILNCQYKMPSYPNYSADIRNIISSILVESAQQRPTAWQVHKEVCRLRGVAPNRDYQKSPSQTLLSPGAGTSSQRISGSVSPSLPNLPLSRPGSTGLSSVIQTGSPSQQSTVASRDAPGTGISPMRRGRPAKGPAEGQPAPGSSGSLPPSSLPSPSAWQMVETQPSGESSQLQQQRQQEQQPPVPASNSASPALRGFSDSFSGAPVPAPVPAATASAGAEAAEPIKPSKTALATAALFEELSSPSAAVKAGPPTLASLAAARNGTPAAGQQQQQRAGLGLQSSQITPSLPPKPTAWSPGGALSDNQNQGFSQGLRKVSPGKPLGPRSLVASPSSLSGANSPQLPVLSPQPDTGRPALASRPSQSAPPQAQPQSQMSSWSQRERDVLAQVRQQETETFEEDGEVPRPLHVEDASPAVDGEQLDKYPALDDWEEKAGFSPPLPPGAQRASSYLSVYSERSIASSASMDSSVASPSLAGKKQSFDLLGDDPDGMGAVPSLSYNGGDAKGDTAPADDPRRHITSPPALLTRTPSNMSAVSSAASPAEPSGSSFSSASHRARSMSAASSSSSVSKPEPPKDKFRPVKNQSTVAQRHSSSTSSIGISQSGGVEPDSSDDEHAGPEEPAGRAYAPSSSLPSGRTTPTHANSSLQHFDDNGDRSGRTTIHNGSDGVSQPEAGRPGPKAAPPLLAPKPTRAGVSGIVSRYETMSTAPPAQQPQQQMPSAEASATQRRRPVKPQKPSSISFPARGASVGADRGGVGEDFAARFPALDDPSAPGAAREDTPIGGAATPTPASLQATSAPAPPMPISSTTSKREPFKPSRESSSNSLSSLAAGDGARPRPKSMHYPTPPPANPSSKLVRAEPLPNRAADASDGDGDGDGEEQPFQGVASLRDRWQKMGQGGGAGESLGRRSSTLGCGQNVSRWK